jgi:hypothetical protein
VDIAANRRANHPTAAGERRNLRTAPENVFGGGGDGITFEDACCVGVEVEFEVEAGAEFVEAGMAAVAAAEGGIVKVVVTCIEKTYFQCWGSHGHAGRQLDIFKRVVTLPHHVKCKPPPGLYHTYSQ